MKAQDKWKLGKGDLVEVSFPSGFLRGEFQVGFISRIATLPNGRRTMRFFLATGKTYTIEEGGGLDHLLMKLVVKAK